MKRVVPLVREFARRLAGMRTGATQVVVCLLLTSLAFDTRAQNAPPVPAPPAATPAPATGNAGSSPVPQQEPPEQVQPENDQDSVFVFKKEVDEVMLHATVVDEGNHLVTDLERGTFRVFEDGTPQAVTSFRREDAPVALGIVIDNSASMREKRGRVNQAVLNLIRVSNPQDQVFVVNFSEDYYLDQDFTSDIDLLQQALQKISARGRTALYDAIVASYVHLKNSAPLDKKVLLVITDGEDNASQELLQETMRRLQQEKGSAVYVIGLLGEDLRRPGRTALQNLASSTGGVAFFPKTLDEVDGITRSVAHDIRSQYTIGYKPLKPRSLGGYRAIRVEARSHGSGKLAVRTRSGYYAGESAH